MICFLFDQNSICSSQNEKDRRIRSNSLPRKYNTADCYLNKSDFWTGSLPRNNRRKVKFVDEPPARPPPPMDSNSSGNGELGFPVESLPPPAPIRTESLSYMQQNPNLNTNGVGRGLYHYVKFVTKYVNS